MLSKIILNVYKSLSHCEIELKSLNVLIRANGSGKSNFIGLFGLV